MLNRFAAGDTLVEVIVAFTVFTLVAVGTTGIMNRGVSLAEQSLEVTLVREQIDAQASLLRYARTSDPAVWQQIRTLAATKPAIPSSSVDACPASAPADSFMLSVDKSGADNSLKFYDLTATPSPYTEAGVNSQFDVSGTAPTFQGMWVVPTVASAGSGGATLAYDMHIGTCWYAPGSKRPFALGTIVRLYE